MTIRPKIVVILGPTATGKSDLAVEIARKLENKVALRQGSGRAVRHAASFACTESIECAVRQAYKGAEIISADSRQVYKGLNLGSGKITKREMKGIKHHLLDVASPRSVYTVQKYQYHARNAMADILRRGKLPIICGGTGLYIDAVVNGTVFPEVPPNIKLRKTLEKLSTIGLFARISRLDPARAKNIDPHNRRRLIRAIEIVQTTGQPVPPQYLDIRYPDIDVLKIGLNLPKEKLEKRIKKRLDKRLNSRRRQGYGGRGGMVKEVENLHKNGLSWKRLDDLGLEYRYISRYLRGLLTYDQMKAEILKESLHYAKRQMTWFKRDKNIVWESDQNKTNRLVSEFIK